MKPRSILILPDLPDRETVAVIRKQFDPLYGKVEPHITLVFSFESDMSEEAVTAAATDAISTIRPFSVHLDGITVSDTYAWIRIIDPEGRLLELHDRLYEGLLSSLLRKDIPYEPHITIGRLFTAEDRFEFETMSKDFHPECSIDISEVTIEEIGADEHSVNPVRIPLDRCPDIGDDSRERSR